jgi:hypothetical protein
MGKALAQLFAMFTTLFTALERGARIVDNIATVGEEMSGIYVAQSRHDRAKQQLLLDRDLAAS